MRAVRWAVIASVAGLALGAGTASAATVTVSLAGQFPSNEVRYVAAPGETNDLTVAYAADALSVTVMDPGAVIQAIGSCASLTAHSAVCTAPDPVADQFIQSTRARLGDMNDRAVTTRPGPFPIGGIDALGGPGDDRLIGSPTDDVLDGGGGRDVLTGGDGGDLLRDGDQDGAPAGLGPDADVMRGGEGYDEVSYRQRKKGVAVDLAARTAPDGDTIRSFEWLTGGKGNDRLAGTAGDDIIDGGGGANRLIGRRGADVLHRATGAFVLCGRGPDLVRRPRGRTHIVPSCEDLALRLPRDAIADSGAFVRPNPRRRGGALGFPMTCPDLDGEPQDCRATVRIRTRGGRLVASGSLDGRLADERFLRLELTALGRRLRADHHRQLVRTVIRGPLILRTAWTIGF